MDVESLVREWDGEALIVRFDCLSGAWIFIAIHSTALGPATGGTRMMTYPSPAAALQDALRLAAGMTYKFAVPGIPRGGGKAVIDIPADFDPSCRNALLQRYGTLVRRLGGLYQTGPDVGTSSADMDTVALTGAPFVFGRTPAGGGAGESGPITALGVFAGIQVVCERVFGDASLRARRVLVQGTGNVGGTLIEYLRAAGATVLFTDIDQAAVRRYRDRLGLEYVAPDLAYETECDVFAPCALGGILNPETIPRLKCRAVAGGANNQLSGPDDADLLRLRGILYAPDFVINVGGAMAIPGMEVSGWSRTKAETEVTQSVRCALLQVFDLAASAGISTEAAARGIANDRLSAAMQQTTAR